MKKNIFILSLLIITLSAVVSSRWELFHGAYNIMRGFPATPSQPVFEENGRLFIVDSYGEKFDVTEAKHHIQYRHLIGWLVRKPGAFVNIPLPGRFVSQQSIPLGLRCAARADAQTGRQRIPAIAGISRLGRGDSCGTGVTVSSPARRTGSSGHRETDAARGRKNHSCYHTDYDSVCGFKCL